MAKDVAFVACEITRVASKVAVAFVLSPYLIRVFAVALIVIEASILHVPIGSVKLAKLVTPVGTVVVMLVMVGLF